MGSLPHFKPRHDREGEPVDAAVADLRAHVAAADAIVICTPEYAGALPGALKNLLEWTVGDGGTYHKPVAWINVSASPTVAVLMPTNLSARSSGTCTPTSSSRRAPGSL